MDRTEKQITGLVTEVIYSNEDNGYRILEVEVEGSEPTKSRTGGQLGLNARITVVGILPDVQPGETIAAEGAWKVHSIYGDQFEVASFERVMPKTAQQIERYLGSGVIKGIGVALAHRIVERFGEMTLEVMDREPERLAEIKGISKHGAMEIAEQFAEQHKQREAMLFMQKYDIPMSMGLRIYRQYKDKTIQVLETNPYRLAEDIHGIGFRKADQIARLMGTPEQSPFRIRAAVQYVLQEAAAEGHVFLPRSILEDKIFRLTEASGVLVDNAITELVLDHRVLEKEEDGQDRVFLASYYNAESDTAYRLLELKKQALPYPDNLCRRLLKDAEAGEKIELSEEQREAILAALTNGVQVITGGPGTGKTTIINTLLKILDDLQAEVLLAAPTGRAAKRMTETTGRDASTVHRMLEMQYTEESFGGRAMFQRNEENPLEADVIIVDEMSMVDIQLMHSLLKGISPGTRLILVGDADQLPSVGPGNVLRDIIASDAVAVARLSQIYRQAEQSDIVLNAHRINDGQYPEFNRQGTDFFLMRRRLREEVPPTLVDAILHRIPKFAKCSPTEDIQVLTPMKRGMLGVEALNPMLQEALNPKSPKKNEMEYRGVTYREGDKVMQVRNNYNMPWRVLNRYGYPIEEGEGVFNGDIGRIKSIDPTDKTLTVIFDEAREVEYDYASLEELEMAYAITIHKAQGSESPVIVIPLFSGPDVLFTRNLLYTAVTRATRYCIVVGSESMVQRMVDNDTQTVRYTALKTRLQEVAGLVISQSHNLSIDDFA